METTIKVKAYMTKPATPQFDFMQKWNNNKPMPYRIMKGEKVKETKGMVYMKLHADILAEKNYTCIACGRPLTNPVSQYFGIGPECGGHNYVHPFESDEELKAAVEEYRKELNDTKWEGWIIKSAIENFSELEQSDEPSPEVQEEKGKVTIRIEESKKLKCGQSGFVSFKYDARIVALMRAQGQRSYDANTHVWEIPASKVAALKEKLEGYEVEVIGEYAEAKKNFKMPKNFKFKTKPFEHQLAGFKYGLTCDNFFLGDEQGLGKTKQVIDIAVAKKEMLGYKHCLIICGVNSLKWNWVAEVATHSDEKAHILGQENKKGRLVVGGNAEKLADLQNIKRLPYFIITNIESLRHAGIREELSRLCKAGEIEMIAVDEIHKCKNPASQQGKALLKITAKTKIAMTGTPLMNTPLDLYIILKWLEIESHSFYAFKNHYAVMGGYGGHEVVGYKNLTQLHTILDDVMLRRLKKEVLDLPEKIRTTEFVEMSAGQAKLYAQIEKQVRGDLDRIKINPNPLACLIRMRQATGYTGILSSSIKESAKLDRLEELVEELVENRQKAIVFSNWTHMTAPAAQRLARFNPAIITGETKDRVAEQDKFMKDESCKVIVGTIGAMGTGLTLTAANTVIFLDSPWTRAAKEQAEDRAHRIGTKSNVNIITLVCKDTIDERIEQLVESKGEMADMMVDGKIDGRKAEVIDFLLN